MNDDVVRELILPRLTGVRKQAGYWVARCPAHEDDRASLSLKAGDDQPVVFKCHAGCQFDDILTAIGVTLADIGKPREVTQRDETTYDYTDEAGKLLFQVVRTGRKEFRQRRPDPGSRGGWRWSIAGLRRVPYRLPKIIRAVEEGEMIYVVEGEKDVHSAERAGLTATCNPGGAGKWSPEFARYLAGAIVVVVADRDEPGRKHARQVAATLDGIAAAVEIREAAEGKDLTDHLGAGLTPADLTCTWESGREPAAELAPDLVDFVGGTDPTTDWVVPDILERGDRLVWTGTEGYGKSMLLRQIAVGAAAGMHPFTMESFHPKRVLYVDCENPERISRKHFRRMVECATANERPVERGRFYVIHRPGGLDCVDGDDAAWLAERIHAHKPDLLIVGPLYKLHNTDISEEQSARALIAAIDAARQVHDCAVAIEAHAGHGDSDDETKRSLRPAGSSILRRWPEFGYGIRPTRVNHEVEVRPWRGPRAERKWPDKLTWGAPPDWPWIPG